MLTSAFEIAMAVRILSPDCVDPHSPFPAAPGRAGTRCDSPQPISSPDTRDTAPSQFAFAVAAALEIHWREGNVEQFFLTGRTPLQWRALGQPPVVGLSDGF